MWTTRSKVQQKLWAKVLSERLAMGDDKETAIRRANDMVARATWVRSVWEPEAEPTSTEQAADPPIFVEVDFLTGEPEPPEPPRPPRQRAHRWI